MGIKEVFAKWREKKKEEKDEFKKMERDARFKKLLEEKQKSPAQKELEFYQREKEKEKLKQTLNYERTVREEKMKILSNPYKHNNFSERRDLMDGGVKWI